MYFDNFACFLYKINRQYNMNFKRSIFGLALLFAHASAFSFEYVVPEGYYDNASGKAEGELKTAIHHIIKGGKRLDYGSGEGSTWSGFAKTDRHPEGHVWDMYSYNKCQFNGNSAPGGMNIEHSVAKSWWGSTKNNAYKDLYHLNPSNSNANSARSNYPLGIVEDGKVVGSLKIGDNCYGTEYNGNSFEPLDEYKGDFARAYLYMFTAYEDLKWTGTAAPSMLVGNQTYPMLRPWAAQMLVEWSRNDPPSEKELKRADEVYKLQNNRNPYIDYPELVEYLWGEKKGEPFFFTPSTDPMILKPANNTVYEFESINYEATTTEVIFVKSRNLTTDISLSLTGAGASAFKLSTQRISAEESEEDFELVVTFNPEKAIEYEAQLVMTAEGAVTKTVNLKATATEEFSALNPTNITENSFVANWTSSSLTDQFLLEVYTKQIEGIEAVDIIDSKFDDGWPSGWKKVEGFFDFNTPGAIKLASGSQGAVISSGLVALNNEGTVTITAKKWSSDSGVEFSVKFGDYNVGSIMLEQDYKDFSLSIPAQAEMGAITIEAPKGKRGFISQVKLTTGGQIITETPVASYPKTIVGNQSESVEGLASKTDYFYRVTPVIDGATVSKEIKVTTATSTGIEGSLEEQAVVYANGLSICIENATEDTAVEIFNANGQLVISIPSITDNAEFAMANPGLYIVRLTNESGFTVTKQIVR